MDPAAIAAWWVGLPLLGVWLVLGASAFLEYVFPPFPGDTVVVVGAVPPRRTTLSPATSAVVSTTTPGRAQKTS